MTSQHQLELNKAIARLHAAALAAMPDGVAIMLTINMQAGAQTELRVVRTNNAGWEGYGIPTANLLGAKE